MAESVTPETARQAVERWNDVREYLDDRSQRDRAIGARGGALAVLVPQLLDQLAAEEMKADAWATEAIAAAKCEETARAERDALGERCHQLETALRTILDYYAEVGHSDNSHHDAARAALGDTPPNPSRTPERLAQATADARARMDALDPETVDAVEPPQPETPDFYEDDEPIDKIRAAIKKGKKGYTTGSRNVTYWGAEPAPDEKGEG